MKKKGAKVSARSAPGAKTKYFVGIDLHKKFMQVIIMDNTGEIVSNTKIECNKEVIKEAFMRLG